MIRHILLCQPGAFAMQSFKKRMWTVCVLRYGLQLSGSVSSTVSARAINSPADRTELPEIRAQLPQNLIREEREKK
jgi:hypothetical protein